MVEKKVIKRRHKDILNFCKRYMSEKGFPPSVREIGDGIGLKSTTQKLELIESGTCTTASMRTKTARDTSISRKLRRSRNEKT